MNVLVVHEVSYEGKFVYEYQDLAERLAAQGHQVYVIDFDAEGKYRATGKKVSRTGIGHVELHSVPQVDLPVLRLVSARLAYPKFLEKFIREKNISVIWLYSVFINGETTLDVARRLGVPVVYRVLDVYHQLRQNPWIKWPLLMGEKKIYREADHVCVTNEKLGHYVRDLIGPKAQPRELSTLYHGVDTEFFTPKSPDPEFKKQLGLSERDKVILFLGTLYTFSGLSQLFTEFAQVASSHPNLKWVVVGDGDQMPTLKALIREHRLENHVTLVGRRDYLEVPRWISIADVTITPFELNSITLDIVPIKILQYLAAGRPMVCAPIPDVMRLVPSEQSGVIYQDIAEPRTFLERLLELTRDEDLCRTLGEQGRNFVLKEFSIQKRVQTLEALLHHYSERSKS